MNLIEAFQKQYAVKVLGFRYVRDVVRVQTAQWGMVCLKPMTFPVIEARFIVSVLKHLRRSGFQRGPRIYTAPSGNTVWNYGGKRFIVTNWVAGRTPSFREMSQVTLAAETLAKFHIHACGFNPLHVPKFRWKIDEISDDTQRIRERIEAFPGRTLDAILELSKDAGRLINGHVLVCSAIQRERQNMAIVHGDYNYPNLVLHRDGLQLIDFDNTSIQVRIRDLVHLIQRNCMYHEGKTKRLISTYNRIRPLDAAELALLKALLKVPYVIARAITPRMTLRKSLVQVVPSSRQVELFHSQIDAI